MATASINWTFGQAAGNTPMAACTFTVLVTRDGSSISSFSVTTNTSGVASGVYYDGTASSTQTHTYQLTPQMTGCAGGCVVAPVTVSWNCAGTAPPPPPPAPAPPPPPVAGCPTLGTGVTPTPTGYFCGGTVTSTAGVVGVPYTLTQPFINNTGMVCTTTVPGLNCATVNASTTSVTGTPVTAGTFTATFTGTKAGCADCVITHNIVVSATNCATQSTRILKGTSVYTPPSPTSFNAADQVFEFMVVGTPGKTFQIVGTGTVVTTSPVQTIPASGVFIISTPTGQWGAYSNTWQAQPAGANPVVLCNPAPTTITGSTCLSLALTKSGSTFTAVVTSPVGTTGVPFTLSFGGGVYGGSGSCAANTPGITQTSFATGATGGGNTYTYGPVTLLSATTLAVKLSTNATSAATHTLCNAACQEITVP